MEIEPMIIESQIRKLGDQILEIRLQRIRCGTTFPKIK